MLMARPPPNGNSRNGQVPSPITLPSFESFCAIVGQSDPAGPKSGRLPATSPSEYSRNPVPESPRHSLPYQQVPYSPRRSDSFYSQQSGHRESLPRTPSYPPVQWNLPHHAHNSLPIHPTQQAYIEPFSPTRPIADVQQHAKVVVHERIIDGKGLCYVYSDGTTCPKLINGDTVNPKWGTTKAGKPRKRLGQACNTCREKKIRCDPQVPKCAQCQKFGRECKFETSVRGSQRGPRDNSPEDSSSPPDRRGSTQHERPGSSASMDTYHERGFSTSSITINNLLLESAVGVPANKKRKYSMSPNPPTEESVLASPGPSILEFAAVADPFQVDARLVQYYFDAFMQQFNNDLYHIYPNQQFRNWAYGDGPKSSSDIMLLHTTLSLGTVFCSSHDAPTTQERGRVFDRLVETALEKEGASNSLQLAQTWLLVSYRKLAAGDVTAAKDAVSRAVRVCISLKLNYERHNQTNAVRAVCCFGLDDSTFDECCRRTFWLAYIMDTTMLLSLGKDGPVSDLPCDLRMPCKEQFYDEGHVPEQPTALLQGSLSQHFPLCRTMGRLAVLVNGFAIIREAIAWLPRFRRMSTSEVGAEVADVQHKLLERAKQLHKDICEVDPRPKKQKDGIQGQASEEKEEPREAFILHHLVKMIIHRFVPYECLTKDQIVTNVNEARDEAFRLLNMLWKLRDHSAVKTACPVAGYALFLAIDITTAAGSVATTLEHLTGEEGMEDMERHKRTGTRSNKAFTDLITCGIDVLAVYGEYWQTASQQLDVVKMRLVAIKGDIGRNAGRRPGFFFQHPLHSPFGRDMDIVYGLDKIALFKALGMADRVRSEADLYEVKG